LTALFGAQRLAETAKEALKRDPSALPSSPYIRDCLNTYRAKFDPAALTAEIERLEVEHTKLYQRYADLPTPRAKEKAKGELAALEAHISELERQRHDVAGQVEQLYRQTEEIYAAVVRARADLRAEARERALRERAQATRDAIRRIECEFVLTGKGLATRGGSRQLRSKPVALTFHLHDGSGKMYLLDGPPERSGAGVGASSHGGP
jgi:hypothetical protein